MFSYLEKNILVIKGEKVGKIVHEVGPKIHTRKIELAKVLKYIMLFCAKLFLYSEYINHSKKISTKFGLEVSTQFGLEVSTHFGPKKSYKKIWQSS